MSLPSQEVLDDIKDLISEITGFKEDDENFAICERYCLSHVLHHTYPFVNRTTVKNLVNSYVSRFYGHGYFRVSQELNCQVKSFLSNEKLFEKNPQYDIQWCLLSLVSSLSSNLTSVKDIPELLPIDDEESESEDFDWKEYLLSDLPQQVLPLDNESDDLSTDESEEDEDVDKEKEETNESETTKESSLPVAVKKSQNETNIEIIFDNKTLFNTKTSSEARRQKIEEFLKSRRFKRNLDQDLATRGKFSDTFDSLLNREGIVRKTQLISEFEVMENILFQFQTGERIFLRKGLVYPALTSVTQETLGSYLESLQPYFNIVRCFADFDVKVTESRYPEKSLDKSSSQSARACDNRKRNVPNVLYMYNVTLRKALEPFQNQVTEIVENMGNYTLLQVEQKLQPYYHYLSSLYSVHKLATKNLATDCNWMSSIRILSVLYNAIMNATSTKMSYLYLNIFLHCFQVYLNIIDSWISFVNLNDPNDEFIVAKSKGPGDCENKCSEFVVRPYKTEIKNLGVKNVSLLDFISEKMIHLGQSLEVLRRLNRFVTPTEETPNGLSTHQLLVKTINEEINNLGKVKSETTLTKLRPEKPKSIFTNKNIRLGLERDGGGGDSWEIEQLFMQVLKEEAGNKKAEPPAQARETSKNGYNCGEFIESMVRNPFFKMTFDSIGMKRVQKDLERAKQRQNQDSKEETLRLIQKPEEGKSGIYPFHKIIMQSFCKILESRVSGACAMVKDIVLKECDLLTHLSLLRSILLFNDSYLIQPFVFALYTQPVIWGSSYSLSLHLKECVRSFYKDHANALAVTVTKNRASTVEEDDVLQAIDSITVEYEVKWPLTLIITPEAMRKYNEIFRLALKLKWAHWIVCGLHFQSKHERGSRAVRHRLQLLRFWLLSSLGRINNYFLAQITPLDVRISSCNDLKDMIHGHSKSLEEIYHNCLLGGKCPEARKLILEKLIPLCMDLSSMAGDINEEKLSSLENIFRSCHPILSRLLCSLEK